MKEALPKSTTTAATHLLSGSLSGLASCLALQPLDLIKTRIQQSDTLVDLSKFSRFSPLKTAALLPTVRHVIQDEGIAGLWKGTAVTVTRNVPGVGLYFLALSQARQVFSPLQNKQLSSFLSGSIARTSVGFIVMPFTVLKSRAESSLRPTATLAAHAKEIYKTAGIRGFWLGTVPTCLRDAPYAGLFLLSYDQIRIVTNRIRESSHLPVSVAVTDGFSSAAASILATAATSPFDVIKTKRQLLVRHSSLFGSCRIIYASRGIAGFFDGLSLRLFRKPLSSAITWTVYEAMLRNARAKQIA